MSEANSAQKTLEVKIRNIKGQERQDLKDLSRVFMSNEALVQLGLEAGQPCYLWKIDEAHSKRRGVIVWPKSELRGTAVQMFKTLQDVCGFKLEDRIGATSAGSLDTADCVVLRDVTPIDGLSEEDLPHWEWYLKGKLSKHMPKLCYS